MFEEEKDRIEREGDELNSEEVTIGKKNSSKAISVGSSSLDFVIVLKHCIKRS